VYANREADIMLKQAKKKENDWLQQNDKNIIEAEVLR
jgi:hypothetical protein